MVDYYFYTKGGIFLSNSFENLNNQKKQRIINAALAEFAQKKYDYASTNSIVKKAQIGKGMLFHYFGNKKNLYIYLYKYVRKVMDNEICSQIDISKGDLPSILRQIGVRKLEVLRRHPDMTDFIAQAKNEKLPEVYEELEKIEKERSYQLRENFLFGSLDMNLLKPEFRNENTIKLIRWALDGCTKELQDKYKGQDIQDPAIDVLMRDYDKYVEIIRQAYYC
jgi:AcrR family transcriptional regulator